MDYQVRYMRMKIKGNQNGFTLTEIIVVLVIIAILAAILIPTLTGYIDKANQLAAIAECRLCVLSCQTLASESYSSGTPLVSGSPPSYANDITALAEVGGSVKEVQFSNNIKVAKLIYSTTNGYIVTYENGEYTVEKSSSKVYFEGIVGGTISDKRSVLFDLVDTIPAYLEGLYKIEVTSTGLLNGYWESAGSSKKSNIPALLKSVIAANGAGYNGSFSNAKVWLDTSDHSTVNCIEYKIGNNAYVYYASGNTYVLKNSAFATSNKINWENNEQAVIDAIEAGRDDVYVLPSS